MAGSVLVEIGRLGRSVPRPDAPLVEVAAWFERKAALLDHAADEDSDPTAVRLRFEAGRARQRAAALTGKAAA